MRTATKGIDYTDRDYEAFRALMINKLQEKMPEYTDTSETDAGIVILECLANGLDILSMYNDIVANDMLLPTTQDRRIATILAKQLGYTPRNQTASIVPQIFVLNSARDVDTVIPKGTVVHTKESLDSVAVYFETMEDLVIPAGNLGNEKDLSDNYIYQVPCAQGTTITEDLLGSSNGEPFQSFVLSYKNAIPESVEIRVNNGSNYETWNHVDDFMDSTSSSKDFIVVTDDFNNCYVEFGSGSRGKIPEVIDSGILATYRIGGGVVGNVQPNTITEYSGGLAFIDSTFNLAVTKLGRERDTIAEIKENAPAAFRTQDRCITERDYSDLLRINFYDFLSLEAVADSVVKLKINIYYQMRSGYTFTQDLSDAIDAFLAARIIPGTSYSISAYTPQPVNIEANLIVDDTYNRAEIRAYVEDYITNTFFGVGEFKFGTKFRRSELEHEIRDTFSGVESFRVVTADSEDIVAPTNKYNILTLGTLTLNVTGGIV